MKLRAPRRHIEHEAQSLLFAWATLAALRHPELALLHAVPNWAGVKGPREGAMRKREGVKAGVPDVHLPIARGPYIGMWLEMKSPTGKPTKEQKRWIEALQAAGHYVALCRSSDEARREVESYLALPLNRGNR